MTLRVEKDARGHWYVLEDFYPVSPRFYTEKEAEAFLDKFKESEG